MYPDHLIDDNDPDVLRWAGAEISNASFIAPYDGILKTHQDTSAAFLAANPSFAGLGASGSPAIGSGALANLVAGISIAAGTTVNLTCGETVAMQDDPVSDVLSFRRASIAIPIAGTWTTAAALATPL